jgi:hypothetical protein
MSEHDEWTLKHKGAYVRTVGMVWECGDECGCTQAVVFDDFANKVAGPRFRIPVRVWEGDFHTDHEDGADAELAAYRRDLAMSDPAREAAIEWQQGVDYDA